VVVATDTALPPFTSLWSNSRLWIKAGKKRGPQRGLLTPQKGRPPPGGEEAEVVVYQPRGVGLMHTRHRPSDGHYTRANWTGRKSLTGLDQRGDLEHCSRGNVSVTAT
jgi:hypothetical protein